jgi:hypothetical protein
MTKMVDVVDRTASMYIPVLHPSRNEGHCWTTLKLKLRGSEDRVVRYRGFPEDWAWHLPWRPVGQVRIVYRVPPRHLASLYSSVK